MRLPILFLLLLVPFFSMSQDRDLEQTKKQLEISNNKFTGVNRLKFLDSLAGEMRYDTPLNVDSIFRVTINYAQTLDSINIAVKHTTNLINYLNYGPNDFKQAKQLIKASYPLLPQVTKPNIIDDFYFEAAYVYYESRNFDEAIKHFDSAYFYAKKYQSKYVELSKFAIAMSHVNIGNFGKASLELQEAATMFQNKKDTLRWLDVKNSISVLYSKNGFFKEAKKERNEIIDLVHLYKDFPSLPFVYYNNAADDNKINLQKSRIKNLKLALKTGNISENKEYFEPLLKSGLAAALAENDSIEQAESLVKELEINEKDITGYNRPFYLNAKMRLAYAKNEYPNALRYATEYHDLKAEGDQYEEIQESELFLSKVYERLNNKDKALWHYKNYSKIKDSIGSVQKARVLAFYQTIYETEKRDLIIQNQDSNIELLDSKNKLKNQWLLFGGLGLVAVFGFVTIIRSRNFAKNKQKLQEEFTQDIIQTQEDERTRLAFELHDSVGQQLMLLTRKSKSIDDSSFENLANDTLTNLRTISQGLYPATLERLGFTAAIEDLINDLDENTEVFFSSEIENIDHAINKEKALHLYRIVQEALNNTIKHAEAKAVFVGISSETNSIILTIKDNGKGFDYSKKLQTSKSLGMKSLMERCKIIKANLQLESKLNKGTQITVKLPIEAS